MEVQESPCKSCPFAGEKPVKLSPARHLEIYQNLTEGTHLCHSVRNTKICRGGRDIQLRILYAQGHINDPTDEALQKGFEKYLPKSK